MSFELGLYLELLFAGAILLTILFFNSIFLYKQKLTDRISMMLFFAVAMSLSEIGWTLSEGNANLRALTYITIMGYCISFMLFASLLNRYLIERFGFRLRKSLTFMIYHAPVILLALFCVTTPVTRWLVWVDEAGAAQYGPIFDTYFYYGVLAYLYSPSIIGIFLLTVGRRWRPADGEITVPMFIFSAMAPTLYFVQAALIGADNAILSLAVTLALVYFITNESTLTVLKTQAHIEAVEADLRIASKIQTDALPPVAPEFGDFLDLNLRGSMNTAKEVGGDFFDYFPIDDAHLCFLIADVSGKGTPAALFMMTAKTIIKDYALTCGSTAEIFTAVNDRLCENNEAGMFATAWIGILDTRTMTLQYTNAGHNPPMLQRKGQPCEEIRKNHGLFLAGMEFTQYKQGEIQLESGDRLLLYTDGVTEAHDRANNLYGEARLKAVLDSSADCPGEQVLERILNDINDYAKGVPQFDDITMVILTIK